jgi:protein-tyrosine kinase
MKSYIERAIELAKSRQQDAQSTRRPKAQVVETEASAPASEPRQRRPAAPPAAASNGHGLGGSGQPAIDLSKAPTIVTDGSWLRQNRILVESDPRQPAEGAYRMLRTRVMRQMRTQGWRRLGITAARPGEGKTVTAINLALAIAAERTEPVVLVDLDLRRPRVARYFGIGDNQAVSLADYLEGRTNSLDQLIVTLAEQGLHCILSTRSVDRSSDLLASPQGQSFLSDLADRLPGAFLIFDLPPLLSTDDPLVVAPMLDATLLVVAEGVSPREDIADAAKLLSEFNMLGAVLNKSVERSDKGYYNYY